MTKSRKTVVEANEFRIVGKSGKVRAVIGTDDSDNPRIELINRQGKVQALLGIGNNGDVRLTLSNYRGQRQVSVCIQEDFSSGLYLEDENGRARGALTINEFGTAFINLLDGAEIPRAYTAVDYDGETRVYRRDAATSTV